MGAAHLEGLGEDAAAPVSVIVAYASASEPSPE